MDSLCMKSFKNVLLEVAEKMLDFVQETEESNATTKKSHQETKNQESVIQDLLLTLKQKLCILIQLGMITSLRSTKVLKIVMHINRL